MSTQDLVIELLLSNSEKSLDEIKAMSRGKIIRSLIKENPGSDQEEDN
jgi:hypothetical protein